MRASCPLAHQARPAGHDDRPVSPLPGGDGRHRGRHPGRQDHAAQHPRTTAVSWWIWVDSRRDAGISPPPRAPAFSRYVQDVRLESSWPGEICLRAAFAGRPSSCSMARSSGSPAPPARGAGPRSASRVEGRPRWPRGGGWPARAAWRRWPPPAWSASPASGGCSARGCGRCGG